MQSLTEDHIRFHSNIALLSSRLTPAEKEYLTAGFDSLVKLTKSGHKVDEAFSPNHQQRTESTIPEKQKFLYAEHPLA